MGNLWFFQKQPPEVFYEKSCSYQKECFRSKTKQKNWTSPLNSAYSNQSRYQLQLKLTILIFWNKFAQKRCFRSKTKKSEHHHWILHIRVSLRTKFQLKLTILIFLLTKFDQKESFRSKKNSHLCLRPWLTLGRKDN